jgi:hypothetical protein
VPAAAVIPAPIAYIKVAAVKKLVVGSQLRSGGLPRGTTALSGPIAGSPQVSFAGCLWRPGRLL